MRKLTVILLAYLLLLSAACSVTDRDAETFDRFREELCAAEALEFTAEIIADYGGYTQSYRLKCSGSNGETRVEVVLPEVISGIAANVRDGGTELEFDGAILEVGTLDDSGLSPVSALPALLRSMRQGHVESLGRSVGDDILTAQITISDSSEQMLWLDSETLRPIRAEISTGGRVVIYCDFVDFELESD